MVAALRETEEEAGIGKHHLEVDDEHWEGKDDDGEIEDNHELVAEYSRVKLKQYNTLLREENLQFCFDFSGSWFNSSQMIFSGA